MFDYILNFGRIRFLFDKINLFYNLIGSLKLDGGGFYGTTRGSL